MIKPNPHRNKTMLRNPTIEILGEGMSLLGDPHLGKTFNQAYPAQRKVIQDKQWEVFSKLLNCKKTKIKVIMGDIFDKSKVDESVILKTSEEISKASLNSVVVIIEGNHDSSKTSLEKTSFDILYALLKDNPKVIFARGTTELNYSTYFIGWEYNKSIAEQIESLPDGVDTIFTHVDFESFGTDQSNTIPFPLLEKKGITKVINGHEHLPKQEKIGSVEYIGSGSLLPYDRSQQHETDTDTYADLFVTINDGDDVEDLDFTEKFVYFQSEDFREIPEFEGCLGVIPKKIVKGEEVNDTIVEIDDVSIPVLLRQAADITGIPDSKVSELLTELANEDED